MIIISALTYSKTSNKVNVDTGRLDRATSYLYLPKFCYRGICINENMTIAEVRGMYIAYSGYAKPYASEMLNTVCDG